jgi:sterol desaturase/sphingolipid hydroxylase (fatty acid hydroxylase superfamily)
MGLVSLPLFISIFMTALAYPKGFVLPGGFEVDIFGFLFKTKIMTYDEILWENYLIYLPLYITAQILFYVDPFRGWFKPWKFNTNYPPVSLMTFELIRSARGVLICSCYQIFLHSLMKNGDLMQWKFDSFVPSTVTQDNISMASFTLTALAVYVWGDAHFYWTHRLLHTSWLYKNVHKEHHESFNPDPFSGLSMHPIESSIYFSAGLIPGLLGVPMWLVRLNFIGLLVFPLEGHSGYGSWAVESSNNHYIHHAKFNWNYGSSPLWDRLCGTDYKEPKKLMKGGATTPLSDREKDALEQAALVGIKLAVN